MKIENVWGYTALNKTANVNFLALTTIKVWTETSWLPGILCFDSARDKSITAKIIQIPLSICDSVCIYSHSHSDVTYNVWQHGWSLRQRWVCKEHFLPRWNPYNVTKAAPVSKHENKRQACCSQFGVVSVCVCAHVHICMHTHTASFLHTLTRMSAEKPVCHLYGWEETNKGALLAGFINELIAFLWEKWFRNMTEAGGEKVQDSQSRKIQIQILATCSCLWLDLWFFSWICDYMPTT